MNVYFGMPSVYLKAMNLRTGNRIPSCLVQLWPIKTLAPQMAVALSAISVLLLMTCACTPAVPREVTRGGNSAGPGADAPTATEFKGIIIANCSAGSAQTLTSVDPGTGNKTVRTFGLSSTDQSAAMNCTSSVPTGQVLRQEFNRDFTRMAVAVRNTPDGGSHVGYVANDANGTFVDLAAKPSGFADPPRQDTPIFNPATGRIWFEAADGLGSVDPDVGPSSARAESGSVGGFHEIFYFTPDGKIPVSLASAAYNIYSPDGQLQVDYSANYRIGAEGRVTNDTPIGQFDGHLCWPKWFMSPRAFICLDTDGTQIYKMVISADHSKVAQTELLPKTSEGVGGAVANADGTLISFISSIGGSPALYTVSTAGGAQPSKVADLEDGSGMLIDWTS
jgi:hypothetical protein